MYIVNPLTSALYEDALVYETGSVMISTGAFRSKNWPVIIE